eukprot:1981497-Alexandrium_andersonii.AAC.1
MVPDQGRLRRRAPPHGPQQHPVVSRRQRCAVEGVLRHVDAGAPWPEGDRCSSHCPDPSRGPAAQGEGRGRRGGLLRQARGAPSGPLVRVAHCPGQEAPRPHPRRGPAREAGNCVRQGADPDCDARQPPRQRHAMFAAGRCRPVTLDPDLWSVAVASGSTAARMIRHRPGLVFPGRGDGGPTAFSPLARGLVSPGQTAKIWVPFASTARLAPRSVSDLGKVALARASPGRCKSARRKVRALRDAGAGENYRGARGRASEWFPNAFARYRTGKDKACFQAHEFFPSQSQYHEALKRRDALELRGDAWGVIVGVSGGPCYDSQGVRFALTPRAKGEPRYEVPGRPERIPLRGLSGSGPPASTRGPDCEA